MSEEERLRSENLVEIHRARDEWEGNLLIGYLRDNGIEATLEGKMKGPESAVHAGFADPDRSCGIFVLEDEAKRAAELVTEFLSAAADRNSVTNSAARLASSSSTKMPQERSGSANPAWTADSGPFILPSSVASMPLSRR